MISKKFIGWDIGGAHTKISIIDSKKVKTRVFNIELWRNEGLITLEKIINNRDIIPTNTSHCITLSAEMCDIFSYRTKGINILLSLFKKNALNTYVYTNNGIKKMSRLRNVKSAASMNWLATAEFVSKFVDDIIIIDIGSTTTDFIVIKNKIIINKRVDDFTGMKNNELLYLGCLRTPIYAVTEEIKDLKNIYKIIPENFSSLADIYQILNIVDIKNDYSRRLDGRSKTLLNSYKRISRSFGFDYTKNHKNLVDKLCKKIMRIHVDKLYASLEKIIKKNSFKNNNVKIASIGIGSQITKNMINRYNLKNIDMDKILQCYPVKYNSSTLTHFPSFAVAALLRDKYE